MWVSIAVGVSLLNPQAHAGTLEKKTLNQVVNPGIDRGGFTVEMPWTVPVDLDRLTPIDGLEITTGMNAAMANCEHSEPLILYTEPGRYTAAIPRLTGDPQGEPNRFYQIPEPGERFAPGAFIVEIYDATTDELLCQKAAEVLLDSHSGATPSIAYIPAGVEGDAYIGNVPALEFGSLLDEFGYPLQVQILVDEIPIAGLDLTPYAHLYATVGVHMTSVVITDFFDRVTRRLFAEFFQDAFNAIYTGDQIAIGVPKGCQCQLQHERKEQKDCRPPDADPGDGEQDYACDGSNLTHFSSAVTDRWADPDSQTSTDSGYTRDHFSIVCTTRRGGKAVPCLNCCPHPVIIATARGHIGGLKVYAEDGTDRAMFQVSLEGSGLGQYSIKSAAASGFQEYEFTHGTTVGFNAGLGATHEGGNANAALTTSTSSTTSYKGNAFGWQSAAPVLPTAVTGWSAGVCSDEHTLGVTFNADLLAQIDYWEQLFGLTSDDANALLSSNADIVYSQVSFRCDGATPTTGQHK
jgi:hypothetical protein